ncbi:unannotated protein [freshwater metagenome]|uniref:Unannotated protein n=1 Tax=freshwater metagenome TaxID=449393 RepID=A0A6J6CNL6_9ZZZZ
MGLWPTRFASSRPLYRYSSALRSCREPRCLHQASVPASTKYLLTFTPRSMSSFAQRTKLTPHLVRSGRESRKPFFLPSSVSPESKRPRDRSSARSECSTRTISRLSLRRDLQTSDSTGLRLQRSMDGPLSTGPLLSQPTTSFLTQRAQKTGSTRSATRSTFPSPMACSRSRS